MTKIRGADPVEGVRVESDSGALAGSGPDDQGVVPRAPHHQERGMGWRGAGEIGRVESRHNQFSSAHYDNPLRDPLQ